MSLRVLVIDDTITYRTILSQIVKGIEGVELLGTANTGSVGLAKIRSLRPDLITLDHEMPDMTGLELLRQIHPEMPELGIVMVSAHTARGGKITVEALQAGAFDFVTKPETGTREQAAEQLRQSLQRILTQYRRKLDIRRIVSGQQCSPEAKAVTKAGALHAPAPPAAAVPAAAAPSAKPDTRPRYPAEIVLIGISTGGPNALAQVIPQLPADLGVPVLIVQHMPPLFTAYLAESLDAKSHLKVKEAEDGEVIQTGTVYIAPGGRHMKVHCASEFMKVVLSDEPPENNCRPAVDVLFRSVAYSGIASTCAVVMTGMGKDGCLGLRLLKRGRTFAICQDAASCVVYGMPKEAIDAGLADRVVGVGDIASAIVEAVRCKR